MTVSPACMQPQISIYTLWLIQPTWFWRVYETTFSGDRKRQYSAYTCSPGMWIFHALFLAPSSCNCSLWEVSQGYTNNILWALTWHPTPQDIRQLDSIQTFACQIVTLLTDSPLLSKVWCIKDTDWLHWLCIFRGAVPPYHSCHCGKCRAAMTVG